MGILRKKPGSSSAERNSFSMPSTSRKTAIVNPLPSSSAPKSPTASISVEEAHPSNREENNNYSIPVDSSSTQSQSSVHFFSSTTTENVFLFLPVMPIVPTLVLQPVDASSSVILNLDINDSSAVPPLQTVPAQEPSYFSWNITENIQLSENAPELSSTEILVTESGEVVPPNFMLSSFPANSSSLYTLDTNNFYSSQSPAAIPTPECNLNSNAQSVFFNNAEIPIIENSAPEASVSSFNELTETFSPTPHISPMWASAENDRSSLEASECSARIGDEYFENRTERERYSCIREITSDSNGVSSTTDNLPCPSSMIEFSSPSTPEVIEIILDEIDQTKNIKWESILINTRWRNISSEESHARVLPSPFNNMDDEQSRGAVQSSDVTSDNTFETCYILTDESIPICLENNARVEENISEQHTITLLNIQSENSFKFSSGSSLPIPHQDSLCVGNCSKNYNTEDGDHIAKLNKLTTELNAKFDDVSQTHGSEFASVAPTKTTARPSSRNSNCEIENGLKEFVVEVYNTETDGISRETYTAVSTHKTLSNSSGTNKEISVENLEVEINGMLEKLSEDETAIIYKKHDSQTTLTSQNFSCASENNKKHETRNENPGTELDNMIENLLVAKSDDISVMHSFQLLSSVPAKNIHSLPTSSKKSETGGENPGKEQADADFDKVIEELLSDETTGNSKADNTQIIPSVSSKNFRRLSNCAANSTFVTLGNIGDKNNDKRSDASDTNLDYALNDDIERITDENLSPIRQVPSSRTLYPENIQPSSTRTESSQPVVNKDLEKGQISEKNVLRHEENHPPKILDVLKFDENPTKMDINTKKSTAAKKRRNKSKSTDTKLLTNNRTVSKLLEPFYKYFDGNKCLICGFESKSSSTYRARRHLITHLSSKNFECHVCGKLYGWPTGLRRHRNSKHAKRSKMPQDLADANKAKVPQSENSTTENNEEEAVNHLARQDTVTHSTEHLSTEDDEEIPSGLRENLAHKNVEKENVKHLTEKIANEDSINLLALKDTEEKAHFFRENSTLQLPEGDNFDRLNEKVNSFMPCSVASPTEAQKKPSSSQISNFFSKSPENEAFNNRYEQNEILVENTITSDSYDIICVTENRDGKNSTVFNIQYGRDVGSHSNQDSAIVLSLNKLPISSNQKKIKVANLESELDKLIQRWLEANAKTINILGSQDAQSFSEFSNRDSSCPSRYHITETNVKIMETDTSINFAEAENSTIIETQPFATVLTDDDAILCAPSNSKECAVDRNVKIVEMDTDENESLNVHSKSRKNHNTNNRNSGILEIKNSLNGILIEPLSSKTSKDSQNAQFFLAVPTSIQCASSSISSISATNMVPKNIGGKPKRVRKKRKKVRYNHPPRKLLSKDDQRPPAIEHSPSHSRSLGQDALTYENVTCSAENQPVNIPLGLIVNDYDNKIGESSKTASPNDNQFLKLSLVKLLKPLYAELIYKCIRGRKCLLCGFVSQSRLPKHIRKHIFTHLDTKLFKCSICGKIFVSLPRLKRHRFEHNTFRLSDFFDCKECGQPCFSNSSLKEHLKSHNLVKKYPCSTCSKEYSRMSYLKAHYEADHPGEKPNICTICNELFRTSDLLRSHLIRHRVKKAVNTFKRDFKKLYLKTLLEKRFKCEFCTKTFNFRSNLAQHLLTHTETRPHACKAWDSRSPGI